MSILQFSFYFGSLTNLISVYPKLYIWLLFLYYAFTGFAFFMLKYISKKKKIILSVPLSVTSSKMLWSCGKKPTIWFSPLQPLAPLLPWVSENKIGDGWGLEAFRISFHIFYSYPKMSYTKQNVDSSLLSAVLHFARSSSLIYLLSNNMFWIKRKIFEDILS